MESLRLARATHQLVERGVEALEKKMFLYCR